MPLPMTRPNRHRVQRQIVELAIGDSADGPAVHREMARPFWDRAVPELERVFDEVAGPHELLRLDRLELDLGQIDGADWPIEFRRKLVAELARSLAQFTAVSEAPDGNTSRDPRRMERWREFLFFLSHGYLPWWGARPADGWTDALLEHLDAPGWDALREVVLASSRARVRLVQSLTDEFLDTAIRRWIGVPHAARVLEHWKPKAPGHDARRRWRLGFWISMLDWLCAGGFHSPRGGSQLVRDLLTLRRTCVSRAGQHGPWQASIGDPGEHDEPASPALDDALPDPWREWFSQVGMKPFDRGAQKTRTAAGTPSDDREEPTSRRSASDEIRRPAEDEAIYLEGAGAILFHPFIEQLFRERGLLAGRGFRDVDTRARAVHLVGLLTFGCADIPEYELVLAKVLCGCALEEPLEPIQLEDDDVAACEAVLRAVLEHWTALRSSSPEWLRQQFVLREGKLEPADSGFLLTIERRAQDVLLARLPWGIGVVGLPWLTDRIFVRWLD